MNNPLLSIVIPTKNRQYTCLFAIESALAIQNDDFEVIVQDCSDTDILRSQIIEKFGQDTRIKYFYTDTKPSMTDNWNMAYDNATGDYQCGIGDDDAVLKEIYEVAKWAKGLNIEVVGSQNTYDYKWPDFIETSRSGMLFYDKPVHSPVETPMTIKEDMLDAMNHVDLRYTKLPMIYHGLVSHKILNRIKYLTGLLFDGTSLDVYSAIVLSLTCTSFFRISYPFTIRGASGKSNSSRLLDNQQKKIHFLEYKHIDFPNYIPNIYDLETTIAESMHKALVNLKEPTLISKINKERIYAKLSFLHYEEIIEYMHNQHLSIKCWLLFYFYRWSKYLRLCIRKIIDTKYLLYLANKTPTLSAPAATILEAIDFHNNNNKIALILKPLS